MADAARSDYLPTASLDVLKLRAQMLTHSRQFFHSRGYWEVETPVLSADVTVDLHLDPFEVRFPPSAIPGLQRDRLFLQTSPEFAMKRLLAAGSGSIFQITKAFRQGEFGPLHNPEFTIVEWYKVGADYHELMSEVGALVCGLLDLPPPARVAYQQAFHLGCGFDPFEIPDEELARLCAERGYFGGASRDHWLNFLLAEWLEPTLGFEQPLFLYDYPASQAALSQIDPGPPAVGRRFELYIRGWELCNGYQELADPDELRRRIQEQNALRAAEGKPTLPAESRLLDAMEAGLPDCSGVALGFDRLVMLKAGAASIEEVLPFPIARA